jgi:pimeloyl-ACP methyl ester carboxylesterase
VAVRRFVVVLLAVLALPSPAMAEPVHDPVAYRTPVDAAPLIEMFRPPQHQFGAGNRGVDYGTAPGQAVQASAAGEVVFAGSIDGDDHVVVLHADGIRTSYSFLGEATVRRGELVDQGQPVGTAHATKPLHFGARAGEAYLDPLVLMGQRPTAPGEPRTRLVADPDEHRPLAESVERRRLRDLLRSLYREGYGKLSDFIEREVERIEYLIDTALDLGIPLPWHIARAILRWEAEQDRCTPTDAAIPPPEPPGVRRIAVLVGGLFSETGQGGVLAVDTRALGYAAGDRHQFSYTGAPGDRDRRYRPEDTLRDIGAAGARLADHIGELQQANPGALVDVIAHSMGGLVARSAITTHGAAPATVVTLGTPHQGADWASIRSGIDAAASGRLLLAGIDLATVDMGAIAIEQMSEVGDFLEQLPDSGWSAATHVVSVATRLDVAVPNHQSRLDPAQAYSTVVDLDGLGNDHDRLPASDGALREVRRALARQAPTCRDLIDVLHDEAVGRQLASVADAAGLALTWAGAAVDARVKAKGLERLQR